MKFILLCLLSALVACASKPKTNGESFSGAIDKEAIRQTIKTNVKDILNCYTTELEKDETLEGKLLMTWDIDSQGKASKARPKEDPSVTLHNKTISDCVASIINQAQFPKAPEKADVTVIFPFYFKK